MSDPIPVPSAPPDLDALRQQYLQCLNALALELPIAVHTDATGIISVYVRALLARLDAQQLSQTRLTELLTALGIAPDQHWDHPANVSHAEECAQAEQRLDAVTAWAQDFRQALGPSWPPNAMSGLNIASRLVDLAAVLTGAQENTE